MPTSVKPRLTTAAELFELSTDGVRHELFEGSLRMMSPAGGRHGRLAIRIAWLLRALGQGWEIDRAHLVGGEVSNLEAMET